MIELRVVRGELRFAFVLLAYGQVELWLGLRRPTRDLRRGTAPGPSPSGLATASDHSPAFFDLPSCPCIAFYGLNCIAADATPPPETWRFGTGLLPTDKFRVTNKVLDVGKSVATYFEWVFGLPRCS